MGSKSLETWCPARPSGDHGAESAKPLSLSGIATVLFICTANLCRSPLAAALLREGLHVVGVRDVGVESGGYLPGGRATPAIEVDLAASRSIDLKEHRSRRITSPLLGRADIVLGMERRHVRDAVLLRPEVLPHAFTLREFVRRAEAAGARAPSVSLRDYARALSTRRTRAELLRADERDDVADPYGGSRATYRRLFDELDVLVGQVLDLLWSEQVAAARRSSATAT